VWEGFCAVEVVLSPKFHAQLVGVFVEESVKVTARGAAPLVGLAVNEATGATVPPPPDVTVMVLAAEVLDPAELDAVRVTLYVPAEL
jgi:hypothetical protein